MKYKFGVHFIPCINLICSRGRRYRLQARCTRSSIVLRVGHYVYPAAAYPPTLWTVHTRLYQIIILFSTHSLNLQINKHIQIIIIAPSGLLISRDCELSNSPKLSTIINFPALYICMTQDGVAGLRRVTSNPKLRKRRTCRYLFLGYGKFSVLSVCVHHDTKKCRFLPGEFAN